MISKESNQPSGFGRLIQSIRWPENIQEGIFEDGQRIGLFRIIEE
jgi:hypothetical protein